MTAPKQITVLPAHGCRRSERVVSYLRGHQIAFAEIELESPEGQALDAEYDFRASPGILVDGIRINPFDVLIKPACRIDDDRAHAVFVG